MRKRTTSFFLTLFLCLFTFIGHTQTMLSDSLALVALYNSTGGSTWTNSWDLSTPVSTWHGVQTTNNRVSHLLLTNNNLVGSLPTELGDLDNLIHLFFNKNDLTGSIPSTIGDLTDLEQLSLKDNELSGVIPSSIGNLSSLTQVTLQKNLLTGSIPSSFGNLTSLTHLYLSNNKLSGSIPTTIGNLTNLTNLSFSQNELNGTIPSSLGDLSNLKYLYLNVNELEGAIPSELGDLSNLIQLSLNKNDLEGEIPASLGDLTKLKFLHLHYNRLSGNIPPELGDLSSLRQLYLQNNILFGKIPAELGDLSALKHLTLASNQLSGSIPSELGNLGDLINLYLNKNQLTGKIPNDLANLSKLKYLSLSHNKLRGNVPDLGNVSTLVHILLDNNKLSGTIPSALGSLPNLTHLFLHRNRLSGDIPNLSNSNTLYVHFNRFSHSDISVNHSANTTVGTYTFSPQNYGKELHVTNPLATTVKLEPSPSIPYAEPSVRWRKDDSFITSSFMLDDTTYTIPSLAQSDIGVYEYRFIDYTLSPIVEFQSLPIYNYVDSLDLEGEPIIMGELIIDFSFVPENFLQTEELEITNLGGIRADSCGCDSKIYLYEFANNSIHKVLETLGEGKDKKTYIGSDGGFNKNQSTIDSPTGTDKYLPNFYTPGTFNDDVLVAFLDTGIDITHPAVSTKLWTNPETSDSDNCYFGDLGKHGYNFIDMNGDVTDVDGHGTGVGGLITENSPVGAKIQVMPIKVHGGNGGTIFHLACGIHYAIDNGADLMNISLGYKGQHSIILENALILARKDGIIACVSAGNEAYDIDDVKYWPARFANSSEYTLPNVLTIAALDENDDFWIESNYGANTASFAVRGEGLVVPAIGGEYNYLTGTSASAPLATLALAINMSIDKNRTFVTILDQLEGQLEKDDIFDDKVKGGKFLDIELTEDFIYLDFKVLLEGALLSTTSTQMETTLKDLDLLPKDFGGDIESPYTTAGDEWSGVSKYSPDVVDWVLVSLREDVADETTTFYKVSALLLKDGSIWMHAPIKDGEIDFSTITSFHAVIEHRNHLPIATADLLTVAGTVEYDFTAQDSYTSSGVGQKEIDPGVWGLYGGNAKSNGLRFEEIKADDLSEYENNKGSTSVYIQSDVNLDGAVDIDDFNIIDGNNGNFSSTPK